MLGIIFCCFKIKLPLVGLVLLLHVWRPLHDLLSSHCRLSAPPLLSAATTRPSSEEEEDSAPGLLHTATAEQGQTQYNIFSTHIEK